MTSFRFLKNLIEPDKAEAPASGNESLYQSSLPSEEEQQKDLQQVYRTGKAPMGNPTEDAPLEQPWYSPDEIAAAAIAPGIQQGLKKVVPVGFNVLKSLSQSTPEILGNEVGAVGKKLSLDELAKIAVEKKLIAEQAEDAAGRSSPYIRASATKAMRRFGDARRAQGLTDQDQINIYTKHYQELLKKYKGDK